MIRTLVPPPALIRRRPDVSTTGTVLGFIGGGRRFAPGLRYVVRWTSEASNSSHLPQSCKLRRPWALNMSGSNAPPRIFARERVHRAILRLTWALLSHCKQRTPPGVYATRRDATRSKTPSTRNRHRDRHEPVSRARIAGIHPTAVEWANASATFEPHEILGVAWDASERVLRSAYRRLALAHHPDKGGGPARFRLIVQAYEALMNRLHGNPDF